MLQIYPVYKNPYAEEFAGLFMVKNSPHKKILFGTNGLAAEFSKYLPVDAYINTLSKDDSFLGKPIIHNLDDIPEDALVLSCVFLASIAVGHMLSAYRFRSMDCYAFVQASGLPVDLFHFRGWKEDIEKNRGKYDRIFDRLCDEKSKNVFQNLVNFKVSGDMRYLLGFDPPTDEQYFDACLQLPEKASFADVGGFDGSTTRKFREHYPDYRKVFFFEPEEKNVSIARQNLADVPNVEFFQKGLSNENAVLHFSANGSASMICDDGNMSIEVARLDDLVHEQVDFIKMDIEGAEADAVEGARETIRKCHPNMAICVYHKPDDFWRIPELVLSIRDDYDLFMRHYTQGSDETVMFFIPRK